MISFINILEFIITSNLLLVGFYLLLSENGRNIGVKFLGAFLVIFGIHYLLISLDNSKICCFDFLSFWFDYRLWSFFTFSFGPLIFLTSVTYAKGELSNKKSVWLHALGLLFAFYHLFNSEQHLEYSFSEWTYLGFITECHNLTYAILSFFALRKLDGNQYRNHKKLLFHVSSGYLIIVLIWILFELVNYFSLFNAQLVKLFYLAFLYYFVGRLIYLSIRYPDIVTKSKYIRSRLNEWSDEKYQNTKIDDNYASKVLFALRQYIEDEKNYVNSELKLRMVSESTGFPAKDISQVVNVHLTKSFSEYLNEQRITEATKLLSEDNGLNVSEVMYKIGFNSKSLFFKYFKERHGMTPFEFKKQNQFTS